MSIVCSGIDPSLSGTSICSGVATKEDRIERFPTESLGDDASSRIKRCELILEGLVAHLDAMKPRIIFIEGYSLGSGRQNHLAELGGLIRWHCLEYTSLVLEVAPTTLKKFVTGSGASTVQKSDMKASIVQRYGRMFQGKGSDDLADSFGLYQMAMCAVDPTLMTNAQQREAVKTVIKARKAELESLATSPAF